MDSNQLKYIAHLTQTTSLTKVAEHFFTSHQVVKKSIAALEDELQVTLVQSTNQGTQLTPAGLCVAAHVIGFQEQYHALQEDLAAFRAAPAYEPTELHLYVTPNMATEYYVNLYEAFFDTYENIHLVVHFSTFPQMLKEARPEQNAIYLTPISNTEDMKKQLEQLSKANQLIAILFPPTHNYLCMHKSSKYAKLTSLKLEDLQDVPLYVFLNTNPFCLSDDEPTVALQYFSDYAILKRNIKKNQAIGIIKEYEFNYYFGEHNSEYILRPLKDTEIQHAVIVSEQTLKKNPVIQDFIHFLQNKLQ